MINLPLVQAAIIDNLDLFRDIAAEYPCLCKEVYTRLEELHLTKYIDELNRAVGDRMRRTMFSNNIDILTNMFDFKMEVSTIGNALIDHCSADQPEYKLVPSLMKQLRSDIKNNNNANFGIFFDLIKHCVSDGTGSVENNILALARLVIDKGQRNMFTIIHHFIEKYTNNHMLACNACFNYAITHRKKSIIRYCIGIDGINITEEHINTIIAMGDPKLITITMKDHKWNVDYFQRLIDMKFNDKQLISIISKANILMIEFGNIITYVSIHKPSLLKHIIRDHITTSINAYYFLDTEIDITRYLDDTHHDLLLKRACLAITSTMLLFDIDIRCKILDRCENIIRKYIKHVPSTSIEYIFTRLIRCGRIDIVKLIGNIPTSIIDNICKECISISSDGASSNMLDSIETVEYLISMNMKITPEMFIAAIKLNNLDVVRILFKQPAIQLLNDYDDMFSEANINLTIAAMLYSTGKINMTSVQSDIIHVCNHMNINIDTFFKEYQHSVEGMIDLIASIGIDSNSAGIIVDYTYKNTIQSNVSTL